MHSKDFESERGIYRYFSVLGLTERFEESLALMKLRFGWKLEGYASFNVTRARPKKRDLPQSTLDLIAEQNRFDIELYECVAKLFADMINKNAAEVRRVTSGAGGSSNQRSIAHGALLDEGGCAQRG